MAAVPSLERPAHREGGAPGQHDEDYADTLGVVTALERTCELEGRLRQAIQDTHPLTTTLDWDFEAADREREALLAIRRELHRGKLEWGALLHRPCEQLEYLEDKLREYRFLEPGDDEHKAVVLSQLDGVRRELIEVVRARAHHVLFGTEVVREVLAFASVSEDSGSGGGSAGTGSPDQHCGDGSGEEAAQPSGVLRSSYNRPPRYPSSGGKSEMTPPRGSRPASSATLQRSYEQEPGWAASSPGDAANHTERTGSASPGAAATVAALSAATHSATDAVTLQAELAGAQREVDAAATARAHELARAVRAAHPPGSIRSASPIQGGRAVSGGGRPSARLLSRLERPRLYSGGAPAVPMSAGRLRDEDIFGAVNGAGRPASIMNPSPRQYGGMVRIRDMLARTEEEGDAEAIPPQRPRIYGDGVATDDLSEWDGNEGGLLAAAVAGAHAAPSPGHAALSTAAIEPVRQRRVIIRPEQPIDDETLWNGPSRMESDGRSSSYRIRYRSSDSGNGRRGLGLLGRLFRLAVGAGAAVAVALAAKAAAPHVAEHGQAALAQLQAAQASLAAGLRERSSAAAAAGQRRAVQRQHKEEQRMAKSREATAVATSSAAAAPSPVPAPSRTPEKPQPLHKQPAGKQPGSAKPQAGSATTQLQIADMPPWLEGKAARPTDLPCGPAVRKLHASGSSSGVKKLPPGAAAAAAKRSAELADLPLRPAPNVHVSMG